MVATKAVVDLPDGGLSLVGKSNSRLDLPPLALLLITSLWAFLIPLSAIRLGLPGIAADVVLLVASVAWLFDSILTRRSMRPQDRALIALLVAAFALIAVMSSYNAHDVNVSAEAVATAGLGYIAGFYVCSRLVRWPRAALIVIGSYIAGTVTLSASLWLLPNMLGGRRVGLAGHPVEVGGSVAIAFAVLVFIGAHGIRWTLAKYGALAILGSSFLAAESATAIVCIILSLVITQAARGKIGIRQVALVSVGVFSVFTWLMSTVPGSELVDKISTSMNNVSFGYSGDISATNTLQSRLVTVELGVEKIIQEPIFGVGFDSSNLVLGSLSPHNMIVAGWLSGGVVAMLLLVALLCLTCVFIVRASRRNHPVLWPLVAGATAAWAAAMSGPAFYSRTWLISVLLFIAFNTNFGGEITPKVRVSWQEKTQASGGLTQGKPIVQIPLGVDE